MYSYRPREIAHRPVHKMTIEIAMGHLKASRPTTAPKLLIHSGPPKMKSAETIVITESLQLQVQYL